MKRPCPIIPRAASSMTRQHRTRTAAAIELVRAEFERERLERDMMLMRRRYQVAAQARQVVVGKGNRLLAQLSQPTRIGGLLGEVKK